MAKPTTPCVCGERTQTYTYDGELRTAPVYYVCARHKSDPTALVNARRELRKRLERKALPAPDATA